MVFSSLFISITGTPVEIVIASIGPISNDIVKMLLKTKGREKNKHRNIALLAISKLNGKWKVISKTLIDSDNSYYEFTLAIN